MNYYDIHPEWPKIEAKPIPGLGPVPINNKEWIEWLPEVQEHRARVDEETRDKWSGREEARAREIINVARDGRYYLATYGTIYQARPDEESFLADEWDLESEQQTSGWVVPFIPYVFQLYIWDFQMMAFRTRGPKGDTAYKKSRQMGLSNLMCQVFSWLWLTKKPFQGRLLSRKEDLVDESNNPDSLFWKIDLQFRSMPSYLLQAFAPGFDWRFHRMLASLTNPHNMNHLAGESTNATAGRGGAATAALLDEFAFMRGGRGIWTALRAATRHRIAVSTVSLEFGTHFQELVEDVDEESPAALEVPHWLHPEHDEEWVRNEKARDTEAGFRQEVLMEWHGDTSQFVYPGLGAKKMGDYPYEPHSGPVFVSMDDGKEWRIHVYQYVERDGRHRLVDSYANSGQRVDFYGSILRGLFVDGLPYDEDAREFMELMRKLHDPVFIMDTHGANWESVAGMSAIDTLALNWGIYVNVDWAKRVDLDRQEFARKVIPFLDINYTPRNRAALRHMAQYAWKNQEDMEPINEQKTPIKGVHSHDATTLEYYATHWEQNKLIYVPGGKLDFGDKSSFELYPIYSG